MDDLASDGEEIGVHKFVRSVKNESRAGNREGNDIRLEVLFRRVRTTTLGLSLLELSGMNLLRQHYKSPSKKTFARYSAVWKLGSAKTKVLFLPLSFARTFPPGVTNLSYTR